MQSKVKKIFVLSLCLNLSMASVSCGKPGKNDIESQISKYKEEKIEIPEDRNIKCMKVLQDESILMVAQDSQLNIYTLFSRNEGATWNEKKIKITKETGKNTYFRQASILKDGNIIVSYTTSDQNSKDGNIASDLKINYMVFDFKGNNKDISVRKIKNNTSKNINQAFDENLLK